jgi:putative endonuclease
MNDGQNFKNKNLGGYGEDIAVNYLKNIKYKIIERNYRCKCGELDIVATDGKVLVFIEVKTRKNITYGPPQLSVTLFKQRQISKAALTYLAAKRLVDMNARFDVIAILLHEHKKPVIDHIKNAFELSY